MFFKIFFGSCWLVFQADLGELSIVFNSSFQHTASTFAASTGGMLPMEDKPGVYECSATSLCQIVQPDDISFKLKLEIQTGQDGIRVTLDEASRFFSMGWRMEAKKDTRIDKNCIKIYLVENRYKLSSWSWRGIFYKALWYSLCHMFGFIIIWNT